MKLVYDQPLPNVPGKSMRGVLVEYEPGGSSPAHLHPKSAFIYATVLEGAISSQVNDGPVKTYRAGESWSEFPGDRHSVSAECQRDRTRAAACRVRRRHRRNGAGAASRRMKPITGLRRDQPRRRTIDAFGGDR